MTLTKRQRKVTAALAGSALWFILWGTMGYFFGIRGVGYGWPAFWAVGGMSLMSLITPAIVWGLATLFIVSGKWIERAEK